MDIKLKHGDAYIDVTVPDNCDLGHVRTLHNQLQTLGAPSDFTMAVNFVGQSDEHILQEGDVVSFRPKDAEKGSEDPDPAAAQDQTSDEATTETEEEAEAGGEDTATEEEKPADEE